MSKTLLILGASSDCGMELIRQVYSKYDVIYAHYNSNSQGLTNLCTELEDLSKRLVMIQDDFSAATGGNTVVETISNNGVWPDHVVMFPAIKYNFNKFVKTDIEVLKMAMQVSVYSCANILKSVIRNMKDGRIIFTLSSCTEGIPPKFTSSYTTVKYALLGMMKSLSADYSDKGIFINAVSPDMMETKFLSEISEHIIESNAASSPLGRNLTVNDVVPAYVDLLFNDVTSTGENILVTPQTIGMK